MSHVQPQYTRSYLPATIASQCSCAVSKLWLTTRQQAQPRTTFSLEKARQTLLVLIKVRSPMRMPSITTILALQKSGIIARLDMAQSGLNFDFEVEFSSDLSTAQSVSSA